MKNFLKAAGAAAIGLAAFAGLAVPTALAVPQSYSATCSAPDFGLTERGNSGSPIQMTCNQHDSGLGTLTGMSLQISAVISGTLTLQNTNPLASTFEYDANFRYRVAALPGFLFTPANGNSFTTTTFSTGEISLAGAGDPGNGDETTYSGINLTGGLNLLNTGLFGTYQNAVPTTWAMNFHTVVGNSFVGGGNNITVVPATAATTTLSATYFYDDGTVTTPEPASMALLGAGMLALGAARRRRS